MTTWPRNVHAGGEGRREVRGAVRRRWGTGRGRSAVPIRDGRYPSAGGPGTSKGAVGDRARDERGATRWRGATGRGRSAVLGEAVGERWGGRGGLGRRGKLGVGVSRQIRVAMLRQVCSRYREYRVASLPCLAGVSLRSTHAEFPATPLAGSPKFFPTLRKRREGCKALRLPAPSTPLVVAWDLNPAVEGVGPPDALRPRSDSGLALDDGCERDLGLSSRLTSALTPAT